MLRLRILSPILFPPPIFHQKVNQYFPSRFVGVDDIPGRNAGVVSQFAPEEPLFATDKVEFAGQPLGLIVADSPRHASEAARSVRIEYDTSDLGAPVLEPEQATEFVEWSPFVKGGNN